MLGIGIGFLTCSSVNSGKISVFKLGGVERPTNEGHTNTNALICVIPSLKKPLIEG